MAKPKLSIIEEHIIEILSKEDITGLQLTERLGVSRTTTSKYLVRLEALGLIEKDPLGNKNIYSSRGE